MHVQTSLTWNGVEIEIDTNAINCNVCKHSRRFPHKFHLFSFQQFCKWIFNHIRWWICVDATAMLRSRMKYTMKRGIEIAIAAKEVGEKKRLKNRRALSVNDSKSSFFLFHTKQTRISNNWNKNTMISNEPKANGNFHTTNKQPCASGWIAIMLSKWNGQVEWSANYV